MTFLRLGFIYPLLMIVQLPFIILGLIVVPVALLWRRTIAYTPKKYSGWDYVRLPRWAILWDNVVDGMEGDSGWRTHVDNPKSVWSMYLWAALRNPTYGFRQLPFYSFQLKKSDRKNITYCGSARVGDQSFPGWQLVKLYDKVGLYIVVPYFRSGRCLRIRLGYKLVPYDKSTDRIQLTYIINPFMTYTGAYYD